MGNEKGMKPVIWDIFTPKGKKMEELFESMDLPETDKEALQEAFEKAILKKSTELLDEHVETLVAEKIVVLEEEYNNKVESLTDSLDGYLDTVVTDFINENAPEYEKQIEEDKVKTLLGLFDRIVEETGVEMIQIKEAKEEIDNQNDLEAKVSELAEKLVESRRESDKYLKMGIVREVSEGLTILETSKFEKLVTMVPFDRTNSYVEKLETIKETIVESRSDDFKDSNVSLPSDAFKHEKKVDAKTAMDFSRFV